MRTYAFCQHELMVENKKILILHTSVGLGHKSIAENIGYYLAEAGFEVKLADIGKVQNGKFEKTVTRVHQFINNYMPFVWGFIYDWGHYVILPFRVFIAGFNYKLTKNYVDEFQPDVIITTQTTASAVIAYLKKQKLYNGLFGIAFSDFHLHKYWLYKEADFYLVNISEQAQEMMSVGIAKEKIFICGIILKPKLLVDTAAIKSRLGIKDGDRVILIGTGSLGIGFKKKDLTEILQIEKVKIIFVCGKNKKLFEDLNKLNLPNLIPLEFYRPMDELYAIADIFVGKPGGLSTAESLKWNLPLAVCYTLRGQEEENLKYIVKRKLVIAKPKHLFQAVEQELKTGEFRESLKQNLERFKVFQEGELLVLAVKRALGETI